MLHQCQYREHDWPALVTPPRVVLLDRPQGQGRTLLNRATVMEHVWRRFGGDVEVVGSTLEVCTRGTESVPTTLSRLLSSPFSPLLFVYNCYMIAVRNCIGLCE